MPDIIIRGMEMPTGCSVCELAQWDGETDVCPFCGDVRSFSERHDNCPLHELPPHGDLIDMDKIRYTELYGGVEVTTANWIDSLPVVVPAERSDADG